MAGEPSAGLPLHLGGREYVLQPQRIGRVVRKLGQIRDGFGDAESAEEVTAALHGALKVFIPDLCPEFELMGYPTQAAYDERQRHDRVLAEAAEAYQAQVREFLSEHDVTSADELPPDVELPEFEQPEPDWQDPWEEEADRSPTAPEIADAIELIYQVNGGKRLESLLGKVVDPAMMKAIVRTQYLQWASRQSQNGQPPSGESASTISGTARQTPAPSRPEIPASTDAPPTPQTEASPPANAA